MEDITLLFLILSVAVFVISAVLDKLRSSPFGLRILGLVTSVGDLAFTLTDTTLPDIEYAVAVLTVLAFAMIVYHLWGVIDESINGGKR